MKLQKIFLVMMVIFLAGFIFAGNVSAATYYIAPSGGMDSTSDGWGLSSDKPWATFNYAWTNLKPGDTLILRNGTYYQSLKPTISGTQLAPITIRSENDGGAIIDGQSNRIPCSIVGPSGSVRITDLIIEGIQCKNSNGSVVKIDYADRIILRRVSAYRAAEGNYAVFSVYRNNDVLLEDVAASGRARVLYSSYESLRTTFRRCWGRHIEAGGDPLVGLQLYGASDNLVENCVIIQAITRNITGIAVWAHTYNVRADNNRIYGNVTDNVGGYAYRSLSSQHRIEGNRFINNVAIGGVHGFWQGGDADLKLDQMTFVLSGVDTWPATISVALYSPAGVEKDADFELNTDIRNSIFMNGPEGIGVSDDLRIKQTVHEYNDFYNITTEFSGKASPGMGELCNTVGCAGLPINPAFNTSKYGKGAYLMQPAALRGMGEAGGNMGAEVLYQYVNGVKTTTPLWPWSMEDRIRSETTNYLGSCLSVTYESDGACSGGLWKTLAGVYSTSPDTTPPLPPTGLVAR